MEKTPEFNQATTPPKVMSETFLEDPKEPPPAKLVVSTHTIKKGSSCFQTLTKAGMSAAAAYRFIKFAKPHKNMAKVAAGTELSITWQEPGTPASISVELDAVKTLQFELASDEWSAKTLEKTITFVTKSYQGQVVNSLWESALAAGMDPQLIIALSEIFAWQVDFNREVRPGDRWRMVVDERFANDHPIGYESIKVAEYQNVKEVFTAIRFHDRKKREAYYFPDGTNLKRMFLKSPIRFGRISSRFQRKRFHPILKKHRPHNGVDYAAKPGTPIRVVGDGRIVKKGYSRTNGKMIKVRHNSIYQTSYSHMRAYAKSMRVGRKVEQGQIIGYVGSTGLATGPHLHFAFYERGRFVDPLGKKFPSADPVPKKFKKDFVKTVNEVTPQLPPWPEIAKSG